MKLFQNFHICFEYSNAVLPSENRMVKIAAKSIDTPPPATPMEKYKLRLSVARQTGRLDLSCRAVWIGEDSTGASTRTHTATSSPTAASARAAASVAQGKTEPAPLGEGEKEGEEVGKGDTVFLTQEDVVQRTSSADFEEIGIFQQVASHRGDDSIEEAAAATAASQQAATKAGGRGKRQPQEMLVDFQLSKIPTEVLRLTGTYKMLQCVLAHFLFFFRLLSSVSMYLLRS